MAVAESETDTPGTPPNVGSPGEETKPTSDVRACPDSVGHAYDVKRYEAQGWVPPAVSEAECLSHNPPCVRRGGRWVPAGEVMRLVPLQVRGTVS